MENPENKGGDNAHKEVAHSCPNECNSVTKNSIIPILWALLAEIAIVLWIASEFFSSLERPKIGVWVLGFSVLSFLIYIVHKILESEIGQKYKRVIWSICGLFCLIVMVSCCYGVSFWNEKFRLENEPKVTPSRVELHRNGSDKITRVLISNPSDSWIYQLTILIEVESNQVPIDTVQSVLADSPMGDKFEQQKQRPTSADQWLWMMGTDSIGYDIVGGGNARLLILYSVAPKEQRALWIRGMAQTNSFAKISVIEWNKRALVLDNNNGVIYWPGPSSNSIYWSHFPQMVPMNLEFGEKGEPTNVVHSNDANHIDMPMKPFEGIHLQ